MTPRTWLAFAAAGALLLASASARAAEVGQKAPEFSVLDHTGKTVKLSDLRGKNVVLWFYPAANTGG